MPIPPRGYPGVFLAYASQKGMAFIDRTLYLPCAWTQDAERRAEAGIPEEIRFASKITLAERMLARAFDAGVPARWVVADSFYGRSHAFRRWLEGRDIAYAVMIPKTNAVHYQGRRLRAEQLGEQLSVGVGRKLSHNILGMGLLLQWQESDRSCRYPISMIACPARKTDRHVLRRRHRFLANGTGSPRGLVKRVKPHRASDAAGGRTSRARTSAASSA